MTRGLTCAFSAATRGTGVWHQDVLCGAHQGHGCTIHCGLNHGRVLGLSAELRTEFAGSQTQAYQRMESQIAALPANASRWVGEMEEIASTFDHVGVTPNMHQGAADVFRLLSETPFALETPETIDKLRTAADTISVVARSVSYSAQGVSPG